MNIKSKKLRLSYDGGSVNGRERTVSKTYNNLNPMATDMAIYQAAEEIVALQTRPIKEVLKVEETVLTGAGA